MWQLLKKQIRYFLPYLSRMAKRPPITVEYPFVVKALPGNTRTMIRNDFKECIGCLDCSRLCPVKAIHIEGTEYSTSMKRPVSSNGLSFEREIESFKIDYSLCVLCGYCVEKCPTGSLSFSKHFIKPESQPQSLVVDLVHLPRSMRHNQVHES